MLPPRLTISNVLGSLFHGDRRSWEERAKWPPDVFGVSAYLLQSSGIYRKAICNRWWADTDPKHPGRLEAAGGEWRRNAATNRKPPRAVISAWNVLKNEKDLLVCEIEDSRRLVSALFNLIGMADEACKGFGVPNPNYSPGEPEYDLLAKADFLLGRGAQEGEASTLCERICPDVVCVLPKSRTPQVGLTFRSLTHHIALYVTDEIKPIWNLIDTPQARRDQNGFNLLLIPSPSQIFPAQFIPVNLTRAGRHRMPNTYRSFVYNPPDNRAWLKKNLQLIVKKAVKKIKSGFINGVIFPELSLASKDEFKLAYELIQEVSPGACVISGVAEKAGRGARSEARNCAYYAIPFLQGGSLTETADILCTQAKHHKWQLTKEQIEAYGLEKELDPTKTWWENIEVEERQLNFFALKQWLTLTFVICEDLARQEPASRLLRAIGPNLVIALLMDNEQVANRWPARYATVLAEDPGCSVLTLTCRGMAQRGASIYYHKPTANVTIALWRDNGTTCPINIHPGASAVVLSLDSKNVTEYSLDGRSAEVTSLVLSPSGIHQIVVNSGLQKRNRREKH